MGDRHLLFSDKGGRVYLATIVDFFSRRVIGYSMADNMQVQLSLDAMNHALSTRRFLRGLIHHSNRSRQYTSGIYRRLLNEYGVFCSMSRRGQC